jgi:hypothetical protein
MEVKAMTPHDDRTGDERCEDCLGGYRDGRGFVFCWKDHAFLAPECPDYVEIASSRIGRVPVPEPSNIPLQLTDAERAVDEAFEKRNW